MDSIKDLLNKKADAIDTTGIRDDIALVQDELNRHYGQSAKVASIQNGVVLVTTKSSAIASDLRLQQYTIVQNLNTLLKTKLERIRIRIQ